RQEPGVRGAQAGRHPIGLDRPPRAGAADGGGGVPQSEPDDGAGERIRPAPRRAPEDALMAMSCWYCGNPATAEASLGFNEDGRLVHDWAAAPKGECWPKSVGKDCTHDGTCEEFDAAYE